MANNFMNRKAMFSLSTKLQKTDTGHIKKRVEAMRAGHMIEFKAPQGMSSSQILYSFKELMYYGSTDKPFLVLITGSSLTN